MRYYEIVLMIHPDQNSEQILKIINSYKSYIIKNNGLIHRLEDWGRRQLAYSINKLHKAYYILMNIELSSGKIANLREKFYFDSIIIRNFIMVVKNKFTTVSPILKLKEEKKHK